MENFILRENKPKLIGYEWKAQKTDKVMCIIHGIGEYAGRYDRMATILNEAGISVVSMDLRGHGLSEGKRGDIAPRKAVFSDIDLMIEYARDKYEHTDIILYGHSMGGNICLDYFMRGDKNVIPVKYIVSAPWIKLANQPSDFSIAMLKIISKILPKATMSSNCKTEDLGNMNIVKSYSTDELVHGAVTLRCAAESSSFADELYEGNFILSDEMAQKPMLLMHGSDDRICSVEGARAFAKHNKDNHNFTYIEWPHYYHEIHNGGRDATGEKVIETIRDFVLK